MLLLSDCLEKTRVPKGICRPTHFALMGLEANSNIPDLCRVSSVVSKSMVELPKYIIMGNVNAYEVSY